jgi:hypothetical protein
LVHSQKSHEGDLKAKRHRIEALESELARYDWIKGESVQSLFVQLMVLVNKIGVLGSEDWSDSKVTRLFMRAYKEKDKSLARMIRSNNMKRRRHQPRQGTHILWLSMIKTQVRRVK